ncbi:MAG: LapA family protein [Thermodesulfobacteriota bacterium]
MKWVKTLFWIVAFFFTIHFSIQNRDEITLRYSIQNYQWFEISKIPLFLVILCSIFLGVLMGGIGDLYQRFQLKKTLRQNQKTIERLEREIDSLRVPGFDQTTFLEKDG